jgi:hypothetical protein
MHLRAIEQEKSKADDAFSRGALSDAAASLEAIEAAYQRLGFHEGLATLRYNRLLMAVEADERAELPRVGRALSETLRCLEPPATPLILQVAAGLKRLLASSVRGLDAALEAELLELAAWLGGDALEAEATTSSREWPTLPTREASTLGAEDAARVLIQSAGAGLLAGLGATEAPPALALTAASAAGIVTPRMRRGLSLLGAYRCWRWRSATHETVWHATTTSAQPSSKRRSAHCSEKSRMVSASRPPYGARPESPR